MSKSIEKPNLLGRAAVAKAIGKSPGLVDHLFKTGRLAAIPLEGGRRVYRREDVEAYIAARSAKAAR